MTQHEQKPESAEFRTREKQLADLSGRCSNFKPTAEAHLIEAEARGAAEQRRKDAKEFQVVGQWQRSDGAWEDCDPNDLSSYIISGKTKRILYSDPRYASTLVADARAVVHEHERRRKDAEGAVAWVDPTFLPSSDCPWTVARLLLEDGTKETIPLYTRPANVAALEARVKELKGVLKEAARALEQVTDGERGGYNARNGKFVCLRMSDGERADIIHCEVTEDCERALEALRAAIREGGEHG